MNEHGYLPATLRRAITTVGIALLMVGQGVRAQSGPLTIELAGQSMIRSDLRATAPAQLSQMRALLSAGAPAVIVTNLEGAIAEPGQAVEQGRGFLAPPQALDALQAAGFNLMALADNHAFDLGVSGIDNTLRSMNDRHLAHAGIGDTLQAAAAPGYLRTAQGVVALVASASGLLAPEARASAERAGVNELRVEAGGQQNEATADLPGALPNHPDAQDAARILQSIRDAHRHAALVIVYQHNHVFGAQSFSTIFSEGMAQRLAPNEWLRNWVHAEVDAGADVVFMHGAPLLHGVEIYHGRPIFYDLGNFIYNLPPTITYIEEPMAWESAVAEVSFDHGRLQRVRLRPVVLNAIGEGQPDVHDPHANNRFLDTRGLPAAASGPKGRYILERIAQLSRPFGTTLRIQGDVAEVQLPAQ